jgi:hypothetical protein
MPFKLYLPLLLFYFVSSMTHSEYLSVLSGYQYGEHGYLLDAGTVSTTIYGANLDLTQWRIKDQGWAARGPQVGFRRGLNYQQIQAQFPIYHWHKHQGIWLQISQQIQNMEIELSTDVIFLNDAGSNTSIASGSLISAEHQISRYQLYWYEAIAYKASVNILGLFYQSEASPAASTISNSTADFFDGVFSGFGLTIGRVKDERGFNFQWKLNLAQMDMSFSNTITQHRSASEDESTAYLFDVELQWHYRYYLAPYWYLVPQLKIAASTLFQGQTNSEEVEYDALNYLRTSTWLSLQRRF